MISYLRKRWRAEGGYREFLILAFPLTLSTASWSVQHFINRVFLTWHSTEALAAALPAGLTNFIFLSFFMGMAQYTNTFVAQYSGAGRPERVGPAVWQGLYLALLSGVLGLGLASCSAPLFDLIGHNPVVRQEEVSYFRVLCYGVGPFVVSAAASCFFSGLGQTWTVLGVNVAGTAINVALDYGLIFGNWGFPAWGIRGAAWATNISSSCTALLFVGLMMRGVYRRQFATLSGWRPDPELFGRLLRFGGPNGLNFMLDILSFSLFVLLVGRIGTVELAATNLAFNVNSLAFMPLIGGGIAAATMVGQRLGQERPEAAEYCTWTGFHLAVCYMGGMSLAYVLFPDFFLMPYGLRSQGAEFEAARLLAVVLLRIVGIYCVFDAMYMSFTAALKGAGDTRFLMEISVVMGWVLLVIPAWVALTYFAASLYLLWGFMCFYIISMGVVFYFRFRGGKWKQMRVIEEMPIVPAEEEVLRQEAKAGA
ncbi:MAG: MATE family efflux transporter [Candidatus Latescibacteria bacterium]|nr:MATE family efflux transporter [Candidatus Latescibacterota bacterium]